MIIDFDADYAVTYTMGFLAILFVTVMTQFVLEMLSMIVKSIIKEVRQNRITT